MPQPPDHNAFTRRQMRLIHHCVTYADTGAAGLPGHQLMLIIAKFTRLAGVREDFPYTLPEDHDLFDREPWKSEKQEDE